MTFGELFLLALSLSMDAFAAAVCKGLAADRRGAHEMCITGAWFGCFQMLMPAAGYLLGSSLAGSIGFVAAPLSFLLLTFIGVNMIYGSRSGQDDDIKSGFSAGDMLPLAAAVSIDALAAGVTLAFMQMSMLRAVSVIGAVTFLMSAAGVRLGGVLGEKARAKAAFAGGAVLVILGIKVLLSWLM